jgi:Mg/Co/Ni transporter MgtE
VGAIAAELFARQEHAGMARFVGVVTPEVLHAAFEVAGPRDLLAVVPLLEWNETLDQVIAELPVGQVEAIAAELDPAEMADLALGLDPSRMGPILRVVPPATVAEVARVLFARKQVAALVRFVDVVRDLPDQVVDTLLGEIAEGEDWESATTAFEEIGPDAQEALFARFDRLAPAHQQRFLAAAEAGQLGPAATALLRTRAI